MCCRGCSGCSADPSGRKPKRFGYHLDVASLSIGKYTFVAYSNDHNPRHVHGFEGNEIEVIIDLREDRTVAIADRKNAFWPENLRIAKARKMLDVAAKNFDALVALWERARAQ